MLRVETLSIVAASDWETAEISVFSCGRPGANLAILAPTIARWLSFRCRRFLSASGAAIDAKVRHRSRRVGAKRQFVGLVAAQGREPQTVTGRLTSGGAIFEAAQRQNRGCAT